MDGPLKVLLLASLILLVSAQTNYESLTAGVRQHVDKALKHVTDTYKDHHVAFERIKGTSRTMNKNFHINVLFSVKPCTNPGNNNECGSHKTLYMIDCLLCKTKENEELLDCAKKREVNNQKHVNNRRKCNQHFTGGHTLFQKTEGSEKTIECPGCM